MSVRELVAQRLRDGLVATGADELTIRTDQRVVDNLNGPTVFVRLDRLTPGTVPGAWYSAEVSLVVASHKQHDEAELESLLMDVLAALETDDGLGLIWTGAQRAVLDEMWPCFELGLTLTIKKEG